MADLLDTFEGAIYADVHGELPVAPPRWAPFMTRSKSCTLSVVVPGMARQFWTTYTPSVLGRLRRRRGTSTGALYLVASSP